MKKRLAAIASAILVSCCPFALAAPVPSADPAVVAATRQMLEAMKVRELMVVSLRQAEQQVPGQLQASLNAMVRNNPQLNEQQKAEALRKAGQALPQITAQAHALFSDPSLVDDMLAEMVPLYAETYTLDEIRQLSAFYASPLGQKMLAKMPTLMARSVEISNRVMLPRIQKLMTQNAQGLGAAAGN